MVTYFYANECKKVLILQKFVVKNVFFSESKTPSAMPHQPSTQQHQQSQQNNQAHQNSHHLDKSSPSIDRPYIGQTSLLPTANTSGIKSEPYEPYSCLQNQSYPYQQIFGFSGSSGTGGEMAYHHQHHVTAAAKLMAST